MTVRAWIAARLVAIAVVAVVAAPGATAAAERDVDIEGFAFSPDPITVSVGDRVTWTNADGAPHTASGDRGEFHTGNIDRGESRSVVFDTAGTFGYHCEIHPTMSGTVVVSPGPGVTNPPTDARATDGATDRVGRAEGAGRTELFGGAVVAAAALALALVHLRTHRSRGDRRM